MSKSKCTNHAILGALLEDDMSKKCRLLWSEEDFQLKAFGRSDVVLRRRQKEARRPGFIAVSSTTASLHRISLHYTSYNYKYSYH